MKNLLFMGNSATGKTFLARAAAYYLCQTDINLDDIFLQDIYADLENIENFVDSDKCEYIQVHSGMTYEDIIYGIDVQATGTITVTNKEKRVKKLCDLALLNPNKLFAIIFDDINRTDAASLLGELLYAMEFRGQSISLSDSVDLCIPENVIIIFTESTQLGASALDYTIRRRIDHIVELKADRTVLLNYYDRYVPSNTTRVIMNIFDSIYDYITNNCAPDIDAPAEKYMLGHGMFMVDRNGSSYFILDKFKQKLIYQIFPYLNNLVASGVLSGDIDTYERTLEGLINTGVAGLNKIAEIQKILVNSNLVVTPYDLDDTRQYYETNIIPGHCSDYKGILESVMDAIILNGVFPYDMVTNSLLFNTDIASIPSKSVPVTYASYLVKKENAPSYYYETSRRGTTRKNPHAYYSTKCGTVGRWVAQSDVAAYKIIYADGSPSEIYLPLNGLRLHTFTFNNVCKDNNPAEVYGAVYRLLTAYLMMYEYNIALIKGTDLEYNDLDNLIQLEIKYLVKINEERSKITAPTSTAREKAYIEYFGTKIMGLRTLWTHEGQSVSVDETKYHNLISGITPFSTNSYEDIYNIGDEPVKIITIKGVVKMTDLKNYQQIMENTGVRQMIFQGPPGTSKTFDSKKFVLEQLDPGSPVFTLDYISQEDISNALETFKLTDEDYSNPDASGKLNTGGWDLVQFHPSYGYEDFIRGIEVHANGGLPSYNSVNRILGKIAEFAKISEIRNSTDPPKFYLVIDEINRANIATVFGELIYGLEYRDSKVSTPYEVEDKISYIAAATTPATISTTRDIILGKNLFIVGTMNTADKSIDSIDYAIRRRFLFIDSPADRDIIIHCYQQISGNNDESSIELLTFDAIQAIFDNEEYFNDEYQKGDVKLGHTYFLRKRQIGYEEDFVDRFVFQIIPILREYVKDGILDTISDLRNSEYSPREISAAGNHEEMIQFLSDNIMLYAKEFGNLNKDNQKIDNEYIGTFIDNVRTEIGF